MYKIYDGDLFLFAVDTKYEADEQREAGFRVVAVELVQFISFLFPGHWLAPAQALWQVPLKKVPVFLTCVAMCYILVYASTLAYRVRPRFPFNTTIPTAGQSYN